MTMTLLEQQQVNEPKGEIKFSEVITKADCWSQSFDVYLMNISYDVDKVVNQCG